MPDAFCCDRSEFDPMPPMHFAAISNSSPNYRQFFGDSYLATTGDRSQVLPLPDERSPTLDNSLTTIIQPTCSGLRKGESVPKSPHPHQNLPTATTNASTRPNISDRAAKSLMRQKHCKAISSDSVPILRAVYL